MDVAPIVMSSDEEDGDRLLHLNDAALRLRERLLAATTTLLRNPCISARGRRHLRVQWRAFLMALDMEVAEVIRAD